MKAENLELVDGLRRQYRRLRLLYLAYLAAAVLALIFFFVDRRITLVLVAASLIYHLVVVRPAGRAYQRAFIHACGQYTLARRLEEPRHTAEPTLTEEELRRARLVAASEAKGSVLIKEGGAGRWRNRPVRLGDAGFTNAFPMDGKTHHEFVVGTWVTVELGRDTGLDWRLIQERVMMKPSRDAWFRRESGLKRVVGFGPDWMEDGTWYALRPEGTPDVPGHEFLAALRKLAEGTDRPLAVCVQGDRLQCPAASPPPTRWPGWTSCLSWTGSSGSPTPWRNKADTQRRAAHTGGAPSCRKSGKATFSSRMQSAARRICPLQADKSHTCGLRSVFSDAHVAGENRFQFFRACGRELCETLSTR